MRWSWTGAALLAASLLLHVGALVQLLGMRAPARDPDTRAPSIALVWIRPPAVPAPRAADVPVKAAPLARSKKAAPRAPVPLPAAALVAAEVAPAAPPEAVFDRAAALGAARRLASEPDPARAATLGGRLEARRELSETQDEKLGRKIAEGKRSDCIKANGAGNLLTPLMWLLEKKGSGCKFF